MIFYCTALLLAPSMDSFNVQSLNPRIFRYLVLTTLLTEEDIAQLLSDVFLQQTVAPVLLSTLMTLSSGRVGVVISALRKAMGTDDGKPEFSAAEIFVTASTRVLDFLNKQTTITPDPILSDDWRLLLKGLRRVTRHKLGSLQAARSGGFEVPLLSATFGVRSTLLRANLEKLAHLNLVNFHPEHLNQPAKVAIGCIPSCFEDYPVPNSVNISLPSPTFRDRHVVIFTGSGMSSRSLRQALGIREFVRCLLQHLPDSATFAKAKKQTDDLLNQTESDARRYGLEGQSIGLLRLTKPLKTLCSTHWHVFCQALKDMLLLPPADASDWQTVFAAQRPVITENYDVQAEVSLLCMNERLRPDQVDLNDFHTLQATEKHGVDAYPLKLSMLFCMEKLTTVSCTHRAVSSPMIV